MAYTSIKLVVAALALASVPATAGPVFKAQFNRSRPLLQDFDAIGPWYDDVNKLQSSPAGSRARKNASIAIVGAGISGLATALMLDSVGVRNWELVEASDRVGGRFRTKHFAGTEEWVEMGPMRLPRTITYKDGETIEYSDHAMVFQLAAVLNDMNGNSTEYKVDFIPSLQHHENELIGLGTARHPDGSIPTRGEIHANSSLAKPAAMQTSEYKSIKKKMNDILLRTELLKQIQRNPWRAHQQAMSQGLDDWGQQAMMRHKFGASANVTDAIWTESDYDTFWDEMHHNSNLKQDGSDGVAGLSHCYTIEGGFNRLSDAFLPHISDRLRLGRRIRKLEAIEGNNEETQTRISWYDSPSKRTFKSQDFDYTVMSAPFTMTRFMDLPNFSSVLTRAMGESGLRFNSACKVALLFKRRFWEEGDKPIFGGASTPPSAAVGALYYPSYGFNETGRPGWIMHYRAADWGNRFASFSDEEHVQTVLDAIVSLHGEVARELYAGAYERLCWVQDEHTATAWARPDVAQHALYIPAYHRTEHNTIFIGEHTAPTHAWVSSSLYSAVRGTVQLLLELGLVDEAKEVNLKWMGRWIEN